MLPLHRIALQVSLLLLLALGQPAMATLGAAPSLVATPAPPLVAGLYTRHTRTLESGTLIQEYASLAGQVFAVTWEGPVLPDLPGLLGSHYGSFKAAAEEARQAGFRGAPVSLVHAGLVLRANGRMGHFFGHAYLPMWLPAGLNIDALLP